MNYVSKIKLKDGTDLAIQDYKLKNDNLILSNGSTVPYATNGYSIVSACGYMPRPEQGEFFTSAVVLKPDGNIVTDFIKLEEPDVNGDVLQPKCDPYDLTECYIIVLNEAYEYCLKKGNEYAFINHKLYKNLNPEQKEQLHQVGVIGTNGVFVYSFGTIPSVAAGLNGIAIGGGAFAFGPQSLALGRQVQAGPLPPYLQLEAEISDETLKSLNQKFNNALTTTSTTGLENTLKPQAWPTSNGTWTLAKGTGALALGGFNTALNTGSIAGGQQCYTSLGVLAMGNTAKAEAKNSIALGQTVTTGRDNQTVVGQFSALEDSTTAKKGLFRVGGGTADTRKDIFAVWDDGTVHGAQTFTTGFTADYAEYFEFEDGNPLQEDRIGLAVTLCGEKIVLAQPGDDILGIVSGTCAVIGDAASMEWSHKYQKDEYGRIIYDLTEEFVTEMDFDTNQEVTISAGFRPLPRISPDYDPHQTYIPREERSEWAPVGLIGKLHVRDNGACAIGDYVAAGVDGCVVPSATPTKIRVMKRVSDNVVLVFKG